MPPWNVGIRYPNFEYFIVCSILYFIFNMFILTPASNIFYSHQCIFWSCWLAQVHNFKFHVKLVGLPWIRNSFKSLIIPSVLNISFSSCGDPCSELREGGKMNMVEGIRGQNDKFIPQIKIIGGNLPLAPPLISRTLSFRVIKTIRIWCGTMGGTYSNCLLEVKNMQICYYYFYIL